MRSHVVIRRFSENSRMDAKQTLGVRGCYGRHPRTSGVVTKPFNCRYLTGLKLQSRWRCCNVLFKQFFSVWFYYSSVFSSVLVHWSFCGRWVSSELYLFLVYYHDHCHFTFFNYGVAHWEYGLFMLRLTGIYFITILLCKVLTNDLIV